MHAKKVCKDFEIKKLGEYHDLNLNPIQDGLFRGCSRVGWGGGGLQKDLPP